MSAVADQKVPNKGEESHYEESGVGVAAPAAAQGEPRVHVSDEDNRRILRKTDLWVLPILLWVYFLQILDKSVIGYSAVFGLQTNAHLVGNEYSNIGSIGYYAQLGAQPLGAYLLVKIAPRPFMVTVLFCWGASLCGMAGSKNYASLMATRFLLGWFEAACLPLFSMITASWYRRSEQPVRVAAWYSTNGAATIIGSALVYALGHIKSDKLYNYQLIFLLFGLITVISAPVIWLTMNNNVATARFLSEEDRVKGVERLRSNNTGISQNNFKWDHVKEAALDPKTYLFAAMSFLVNVGASVSNVFGPLILKSLAGFDSYTTTLLNMPFGALQLIMTLSASYAAQRFKNKSLILALYMIPVVIGSALLYTIQHTKENTGPLLVGYYFLSFLFAANPLVVSMISANTAGGTKKAALFCLFNAASSAGNIVGPQLFKSKDSPDYIPGLKAVLAIFCVLIGVIGLFCAYILFLNKRQEKRRVANGKPAKIHDLSMDAHFDNSGDDQALGKHALEDLTDGQNDEFIYVI
ncbi:putative permease of the major facilitator superfamily [Pseudohyphozyma bogoriensis]|nr:putative permease of the major facilitator superfamily [Pseudohyphozyma bogoriensis]